MTDRINPLSRDWGMVAEHCHQRIAALTTELVELGYTHTEVEDAQRRAVIAELRAVLDLAKP